MKVELLGIGNALVDVVARVEDEFIEAHQLAKGVMVLIDEAKAEQLYAAMPPATEISGGSAANTMAGFASFGGKGAFVGKVRDDQLGDVFAHDLTSLRLAFPIAAARQGPPTGRCLVAVTADAQRTMATFLGIAGTLGPNDIDEAVFADADIVYLEGYLWDRPEAKEAYVKAAELAHRFGHRVALTLSDPFCVERHHDDFWRLIENHVDILFANAAELQALTGTADFATGLAAIDGKCQLAAITRGPEGSVIVNGSERIEIAAAPVETVIDTTGAGDLYAAGVLFGLVRDYSLATAGALGSLAAGEVIAHFGARPQTSLHSLAKARGLIH